MSRKADLSLVHLAGSSLSVRLFASRAMSAFCGRRSPLPGQVILGCVSCFFVFFLLSSACFMIFSHQASLSSPCYSHRTAKHVNEKEFKRHQPQEGQDRLHVLRRARQQRSTPPPNCCKNCVKRCASKATAASVAEGLFQSGLPPRFRRNGLPKRTRGPALSAHPSTNVIPRPESHTFPTIEPNLHRDQNKQNLKTNKT